MIVGSVSKNVATGVRTAIVRPLKIVSIFAGGKSISTALSTSASSAFVMRITASKMLPASVRRGPFVRVPSAQKRTCPVVVTMSASSHNARTYFSLALKRPRLSA
jgi:hypothetical protein